ncbi:hypothetical protein MRX96_044910 [Rhipicephalus microplus]
MNILKMEAFWHAAKPAGTPQFFCKDHIQSAQGQTTSISSSLSATWPDGKLLPAAEVAQFQLIYRNHTTTQDMYVLDQICTPLPGKPSIKKLQMLTFVNTITDKVKPKEEFPAVFQGLGKLLE